MKYTVTVPELTFTIETDNSDEVWDLAVYDVSENIVITPDPLENQELGGCNEI